MSKLFLFGNCDLIALYAKGVYTREIQDHLQNMYGRNDLLVIVKELWGKPTVIFYKTDKNGIPIALNEVSVLDIEDGHIIGIKGYFFCPEFMEAAACLIYKGGMQPIKLECCHPVFRLSAEYKDKLYDELKNKGVKVEENPKNKSHFVFYDIDENMIEVYLPGIYDQ